MLLAEQSGHTDLSKASSNLLGATLSDPAQRTAQVMDRFGQVSLEQPAGSDPAPSDVIKVLGARLGESLNIHHAAVFELLGKQDLVIASIHDLFSSTINKDKHPTSLDSPILRELLSFDRKKVASIIKAIVKQPLILFATPS